MNQNLLHGVVSANPRGFGFVTDAQGQEYFVPPAQMKRVIPGDMVQFQVVQSPRNPEQSQAQIVGHVSRPESFWLGHLVRCKEGYELKPDDAVHCTLLLESGAPPAETDVIQLRVAPGASMGASRVKAQLVANLGPRNRADFDVRYAMAKWRLPVEFSPDALAEAKAMQEPQEGDCSPDAEDLTAIPFVTIDGDSTNDFDDAVAIEQNSQGWLLRVAIADVSRYVQEGSALAADALQRGTSVYLVDRVLPMLPMELSQGVCSLNPGALRYAVVSTLQFSKEGKLQTSQFSRALIRSAARLTYREVAEYALPPETPDAVRQMLSHLWTWFETQRPQRELRGLMDTYPPEPKLKLTAEGEYHLDWVPILRSNELVEECMLAANQAAARYLTERGQGQLFRHQPGLDAEKWGETLDWLGAQKLVDPQAAQALARPTLIQLRELLQAAPVGLKDQMSFRIRRCMTPAGYDPKESSHFSLGFEAYTHFTSPIRRYADLQVHRLILGAIQAPDITVTEHISVRSKVAKVSSRHPWERIKRRLLWQESLKVRGGQIVSMSSRGLKASVREWEVLCAVDAEVLWLDGWAWSATRSQWTRGAESLSLGQLVQLRLEALKEDGPICELAASVLTSSVP